MVWLDKHVTLSESLRATSDDRLKHQEGEEDSTYEVDEDELET